MNRIIKIAASATTLFVASCASLQKARNDVDTWYKSDANQKFLAAARPVVAEALATYAAQGGKLSNAQGAAIGIQAATALAPTITSNQELQNLIVNTAVVYSGDPKMKNVGQDVAMVVTKSLPATPTPDQSKLALVNAGTILSTAAAQ